MDFSNTNFRAGRLAGLFAILSIFALSLMAGGGSISAQELKLDPVKVTGPDSCAECHERTLKVWKKSKHATSFKIFPRSKNAKKIAKAMGVRRLKSKSVCLECHFTSAKVKKKVKPIAGITCESCHGAGRDYIKVHSDYGGKGVNMDNEPAAHKTKRYEDSEAAGMIRPLYIYDVANNCFGCHTVPNEKLVNVGGHPAGSKFDLVAWSQGEVRHNVWYSKANEEASANRKRQLYVVGKVLDLEHALRGLGKASAAGKYADAMKARAQGALQSLEKIAGGVKSAELASIITAAKSSGMKLGDAGGLNGAADKIKAAGRKFASSQDGSGLASVDSMIPGSDKYMGKAAK